MAIPESVGGRLRTEHGVDRNAFVVGWHGNNEILDLADGYSGEGRKVVTRDIHRQVRRKVHMPGSGPVALKIRFVDRWQQAPSSVTMIASMQR